MHETIDSFEAAWKQGRTPVLEQWLDEAAPVEARRKLVYELLCVELWWRAREGDVPAAAEYAARLPFAAAEVSAAFKAFDRESTRGESAFLRETGEDQDTSRAAHDDVSGPDVPQQLGRYRVDALLGSGGFGAVYRAWDENLQREVAVKVTHARFVRSDDEQQTFLGEARMVARFDHPGIVPVYDAGQAESGDYFVVSKLINGDELGNYARREQPALARILQIVADVADAIHYAHQQGIIHRDLKPQNILIARDGRTFLTDFGIAMSDDELGTGPEFVGTLSYMSPEQVSGTSHRVDGRSDVFSLGVVLYELLADKRPFRAQDQAELVAQIREMEPQPLRQTGDGVSVSLERVCFKALAKSPSDRYATARDFADDLRSAAGGPMDSLDPIGARVGSVLKAGGSRPSGRRLVAIAGALLLLAACGAGIGQLFQPNPPGATGETRDSRTPVGGAEPSAKADAIIREFRVEVASNYAGDFLPLDEVAPLHNGDGIQFSVDLAEEAWVRIVWINAVGTPKELYPRDPYRLQAGTAFVERSQELPVRHAVSPPEGQHPYRLSGESGTEAVVLLVSRKPMTDVSLEAFQTLPPNNRSDRVLRYRATRRRTAGLITHIPQNRSLTTSTTAVRNSVVQLLERLRHRADVVMAVTIPHESGVAGEHDD